MKFGFLIFSVSVLMILAQIPNIVAEETVTFTLTDRVGTAFGNKIEGDFTLKASGSVGIVRMAVYINEQEVYNTTGNSISWRFSTKTYGVGPTNITVIGWDAQDVSVETTKSFEFLSPQSTNTILVITIGVAVIATILKYKYRFRKQTPKQIKDSVDINPDDL